MADLECRWRHLDIDNPPNRSGIYAICQPPDLWLYIGMSTDIGRRITSHYHPVRVARSLESLDLSYWWTPCPVEGLHRLERRLHRQHNPVWCGFTGHGIHGMTWHACSIEFPPGVEPLPWHETRSPIPRRRAAARRRQADIDVAPHDELAALALIGG